MKLLLTLAAAASVASLASAEAPPTYGATVLRDETTLLCTLTSPPAETQRHRAIQTPSDVIELTKRRQNRRPEELLAHEPEGLQKFVTVLGGSLDAVAQRVAERCPLGIRSSTDAAAESGPRSLRGASRSLATVPTEVRKIVDSGDPANRIDVVFMGDGYTLNETTRFFDDITRLTNDMFTGDTFAQYLPLFNIWAAYVPSVESGIGVGGKPRNTAFQLYRDGTELRGVYTNKAQAARDVCATLGPKACDFPSLIGNDDFYGGLGGEFVIATRSPTTGTVVLRHEMGHNFGNVGEEYDGGQVYRGANSVRTIAGVTWAHWLTDPTRRVEEKAAQLYQKHIWYNLQKGAYTINFTSTGAYKRWFLQFSVSGTDTDDSLSVTLDGKPLAWKSNGVKDRSFYQWSDNEKGFTAGAHQLVIKAGGSFDSPIIKQLCNAIIYEYGDENDYKMDDPLAIGLYPTYDINKAKSYRPDNERCLMRNMTSSSFCIVCQENMWIQFLARIEFIDDVVVSGRNVSLKLIPLGQFRLPTDTFVQSNPTVAMAERYTVQWLRNGVELEKYRDVFTPDFSGEPAGRYTARVKFLSPNVRVDPNNFMVSEKTFTLA